MAGRAESLDGLRGFAAVVVVFHHTINLCDLTLPTRVIVPPLDQLAFADWPGRLTLAILSGASAVNIFFVLSGVVLMASLLRERLDIRAAGRFVVRRILRIYPALIVMVVTFGIASRISLPAMFGQPFSAFEILKNCLLLDYQVNGATWTLQVEMIMVPLILIVAFLHRIFGPIAMVGFLIFSLGRLYGGALFGMITMAMTLPAFALGVLIPTEVTRQAVARLPSWFWAPAIVGIIVVQFSGLLRTGHGALASLVLSFVAVAVLFHLTPDAGLLARPFPRFLGRISYSLYLWHACVIYEVFPALQWAFTPQRVQDHYLVFGLLYGLFVLAICVPISMLSERWIERPFIEVGRKLFRPRNQVPAGAA